MLVKNHHYLRIDQLQSDPKHAGLPLEGFLVKYAVKCDKIAELDTIGSDYAKRFDGNSQSQLSLFRQTGPCFVRTNIRKDIRGTMDIHGTY